MNVKLSVLPPASNRHNSTCPICEGNKKFKPPFKDYHTKHGALKDEKVLAQSLKKKGVITSDKEVGNVYPFDGGDDDHQGWKVKKDVFEDVEVSVRPTPHHLIPGNAAMAPSSLEKWTLAKHGKIVEDIGYSVDCTRNGLWLPHLPHVYWTSYRTKTKRWCDKYGKWSELDPDDQFFVGKVVMGETNWQMHYTDHDDPYVDMPHGTTYDKNARDRCDLLGKLMTKFWSVKCKEAKDPLNGKAYPPYGLVERINLQSDYMKQRMTGPPGSWKEFVSLLAQQVNKAVKGKKLKIKKKGVVWLA